MQKRIPALDGLRGIAIIIVVIHHFQSDLMLPGTLMWKLLQRIPSAGWFGVDIFFVLSGFLITSILLDEGIDWKRFYRNRAFRILPAFLVVFIAVLGFVPRPAPWVILAYLFFLGNFTILGFNEIDPLNHIWSLSVEEQFYLVWPQVAWRLSRPAILKIAISLAALSMSCRFIAAAFGANAYELYKVTPTHLDGISLGCAVAAAVGLPSVKSWLTRRWKTVAWLSVAVMVAGFVALRLSFFAWDVRAQIIAIPAVSALTAALVFAASEQLLPLTLSAVLCSRTLIYFGKRSYGLYLIHQPIGYGLLALFGQPIQRLSRRHGQPPHSQ